MATLSVKPSQRFRLPDWHTNSHLLSANSERQRDASHQIRQEARVLRNETNNQVGGQSLIGWAAEEPHLHTLFIWLCLFQTIWDEHDNRTRLAERVATVNRWKEMLDKCLTDLDAEIDALTQAGGQGRMPGDPAAGTPHPPHFRVSAPLMGVLGGMSPCVTHCPPC